MFIIDYIFYRYLQLCTVIYCCHLLQPSYFVVLLIAATDYCCDLLQLLSLFVGTAYYHVGIPCSATCNICWYYFLLQLTASTGFNYATATHCYSLQLLNLLNATLPLIATATHCNYVLLLLNLLWHCSATITLYIHCHYYLQILFSTTMYCCYAVLPVSVTIHRYHLLLLFSYCTLRLFTTTMYCYNVVLLQCYYLSPPLAATIHCCH